MRVKRALWSPHKKPPTEIWMMLPKCHENLLEFRCLKTFSNNTTANPTIVGFSFLAVNGHPTIVGLSFLPVKGFTSITKWPYAQYFCKKCRSSKFCLDYGKNNWNKIHWVEKYWKLRFQGTEQCPDSKDAEFKILSPLIAFVTQMYL